MSGKSQADPRRRRSLRVVRTALPATVLRTERLGPAQRLATCVHTDLCEDTCEKRVQTNGAMTDRPRLPGLLTEDIQASPLPSTSPTVVLKKPLSVHDPHAFPHLFELYMELQAVQALPPLVSSAGRCLALPPPSKPRTLVLDLDETLIHRQVPGVTCETVLTVEAPQGSYLIGLSLRPYLSQVLTELEKTWELVVFTAAQKSYADAIIDYLDPGKRLISHRLYREHCLYVNSKPIKDLSILTHRNLANTVIVDNSIHSYAYHLSNGVPIPSWRGSLKDRELLKLNRYLKKLVACEDVREENRKMFDLEHFCREFRRAERKVGS